MFIPADFKIPRHLSNEQFRFEVLEPGLCELDYEAVMSSRERLRHVFVENDDWPADDMSFEFNKKDLIMHEDEFKAREAFAYAVFNPMKDNYIGCVYINPTRFTNFDCEVYLWVKDSEVELDQALLESVDRWLQEEWPFKQRAYPGRSIDFAGIVSIPL
ncbi:MAG: hypothetical protein GY896_10640 [Gammaproteobacteria bacterium]|nr:hypothetical protein [Gammaproteobacteria bacterium]